MLKSMCIIIAALFSTSVHANTLYDYLLFYTPPDNMTLIKKPKLPLEPIEKLLRDKKTGMKDAVADKVLSALNCAYQQHVHHKPVLAVIDFSSPSNLKRFWVFDLKKNKLLYHTYVSHGIKSGERISSFFSNINHSKASSLGVFKTLFSYYGRHGYALRLDGLEENINSNAQRRAIVMHGGWYVNDDFIQKYGRAGRSWGCPALPLDKTKGIIDTIKNDALLVAYYPSDRWFTQSKYINCEGYSPLTRSSEPVLSSEVKVKEDRSPILYVEKNGNDKREENEPILILSAEKYQKLFKRSPPLKRMIRRPVKHTEYIALNQTELKQLIREKPEYLYAYDDKNVEGILFVIPEVKRVRGYYATEMKAVRMGKIEELKEDLVLQPDGIGQAIYTLERNKKPPLALHSTGQFIRWLGL